VATSAQVEGALRSLQKSLTDARLEPDAVPMRVIVCVVPDLREAWRAELKDSKLKGITSVPSSEPGDVRITLIEGRLNVGFAFLTGKIRVDAAPSDLLMIRRLF
jgi:hypothetical protein